MFRLVEVLVEGIRRVDGIEGLRRIFALQGQVEFSIPAQLRGEGGCLIVTGLSHRVLEDDLHPSRVFWQEVGYIVGFPLWFNLVSYREAGGNHSVGETHQPLYHLHG